MGSNPPISQSVNPLILRYRDWVGAIGYSGYLDNEEASEAGKVRQAMERKMKAGYSSCPVSVGLRIERFAADCFH